MNARTFAFVALFALLLTTTARAQSSQPEGDAVESGPTTRPSGNAPAYELPADGDAVVLVMDSRGGAVRRVSDDPLLTVQADGTVRLAAPWGMRKAILTKIPLHQLQALLATVLSEHRFEQIDSGEIQAAIRNRGRVLRVADASTSTVRIDLPGHRHEVSMYAVGIMARQYPDIEALRDFAELLEYLGRFVSRIHAGGEAGIAARLAVINKALLAEHEEAAPFTPEDMRSAVLRPDGALTIRFFRNRIVDEGVRRITTADARFPAEGEPAIRIGFQEVKERKQQP